MNQRSRQRRCEEKDKTTVRSGNSLVMVPSFYWLSSDLYSKYLVDAMKPCYCISRLVSS